MTHKTAYKADRFKVDLEGELFHQMEMLGLELPVRQYKFHPVRHWRIDFAWPALRILLEVQGGTFVGGAHVRGERHELDIEKLNSATLAGYSCYQVNTRMVRDGRALQLIETALGQVKKGK